MLFHKFISQEERRAWGGSDFIELQYCRLARGSELKKIISVDAISAWKTDSLYVFGDDGNLFLSNYCDIFCGGIYNNEKRGVVDICGINYYSPDLTAAIMEQVEQKRPLEYETLLSWLSNVKHYNGFYILGG